MIFYVQFYYWSRLLLKIYKVFKIHCFTKVHFFWSETLVVLNKITKLRRNFSMSHNSWPPKCVWNLITSSFKHEINPKSEKEYFRRKTYSWIFASAGFRWGGGGDKRANFILITILKKFQFSYRNFNSKKWSCCRVQISTFWQWNDMVFKPSVNF